MISISHWGLFPAEPRILLWPKGFKVSLEGIRQAAKTAGFSRVVIDKSDVID